MSRIGNKAITIPAGVEVKIEDGNVVTVKGPKGTLTKTFHKDITIEQDAGVINIKVNNPEEDNLQGLSRTLLNNTLEELKSYAGKAPQSDDITMVMIKYL